MSFVEDENEEWTLLDSAREGELEPFKELFSNPGGVAQFLTLKDPYSDATPLHMAAANGHVELLKFLIQSLPEDAGVRKDAVNAQNNSGNTPLHWATLTGSFDCVKCLCEAGADPLLKNSANIDSCYQADCSSHEQIATYLFNIADPEPKDLAGEQGDENNDADLV